MVCGAPVRRATDYTAVQPVCTKCKMNNDPVVLQKQRDDVNERCQGSERWADFDDQHVAQQPVATNFQKWRSPPATPAYTDDAGLTPGTTPWLAWAPSRTTHVARTPSCKRRNRTWDHAITWNNRLCGGRPATQCSFPLHLRSARNGNAVPVVISQSMDAAGERRFHATPPAVGTTPGVCSPLGM
jgi:hypothetical protein